MSAQRVVSIPTSVMEHLTAGMPRKDWPEPLALESELPPVARLAPELLPASFRSLVVDIAGACRSRWTIQP